MKRRATNQSRQTPDITERLRQHLNGSKSQRAKIEAECAREEARKLARQVALKGLALAREGKYAEAEKKHREAIALEKEWRKLGGKGPLT